MKNEMLIECAKKVMQNAYSPYSQFKVGAAILCDQEEVYTGCNIENASYGATVCAERVAIFKAISNGKKKILKIAIASSSGKYTFPCGICRQVMVEFMSPDAYVILEEQGCIKEYRLSDLLPEAFRLL